MGIPTACFLVAEALLMSAHNICFCGENYLRIMFKIPPLNKSSDCVRANAKCTELDHIAFPQSHQDPCCRRIS